MRGDRYRLPYEDPGQRRPWVPYAEWVARREAERLRVPGVARNDRVRYAQEVREGVRMPRDAEFQQMRGRRARDFEREADPVVRRNVYRRRRQKTIDQYHQMHQMAGQLYDVGLIRGAYGVYPPQEDAFDRVFDNYAGRMEEFVYQGEEEPEEAYKRLREDDDVANLPVLDPKRVKIVDE